MMNTLVFSINLVPLGQDLAGNLLGEGPAYEFMVLMQETFTRYTYYL